MAAQAALSTTCFSATAQMKTPSKSSMLPDSRSLLQFWNASKIFKTSRLMFSPASMSASKATIVAFATLSGQMERSVSIRFDDEAAITSEPFGEKQLKVNVSLTSVGTRRAFDLVLESLRKSAPPVQGFRKAKGGKSVIPRDVLYKMLGPSSVDSFVVEEMVSSSVLEYVEKEGLKVKKDFKTIQSNKELAAQFKSGKEFVFEAILSLEDEEEAEAAASVEES